MSLRKNVTLLCSLVNFTLQMPLFAADSGESKVIKPVISNTNTGPQIEFEVSVEEQGDYYISFAMYGNFEEKYTVLLDGHKRGCLYMNTDGLQNVLLQKTVGGLDGKSFNLKKGTHTITVLGNKSWDVPNVIEIKTGKSIDEAVFSFQKPSNRISESSCKQINSADKTFSNDPLYDFWVRGNVKIDSSFVRNFSFEKDQQVLLEAAPIYGFYPEIYLFKSDNLMYTWMSDTYKRKLSIDKIPETGIYKCIVIPYGSPGYCANLKLNGANANNNFWVSNRSVLIISKSATTYSGTNFFTSNLSSDCDPVMYVANSSGIIAYNDDHQPYDRKVWKRNSHCVVNSSDYQLKLIILPFAGVKTGTADVYAWVKDNDDQSSNFNSRNGIIMLSSTQEKQNYNCFSWSGGITSGLSSNFRPGCSSGWCAVGGNAEINCFDNFYGNITKSRFAGAPNYERCNECNPYPYQWVGSNYAGDAVIDVWSGNGNDMSHATVSKFANNQYHGFAWESKDGDGHRYFHERIPQPSGEDWGAFGKLSFSYRPKLTTSTATISTPNTSSNIKVAEESSISFASTPKMEAMGINHPISFDESIALGLTVFRNTTFTAYENIRIKEMVSAVSEDIRNEYSAKLSAWKKNWKDSSIVFKMNLKNYDKSKEQKNLKDFYKKHNEKVWPLLIEMVREKELDNELVLEDALVDTPMGKTIIDEISAELSSDQFSHDGALIFTGSEDRCIMICKKMLQQM